MKIACVNVAPIKYVSGGGGVYCRSLMKALEGAGAEVVEVPLLNRKPVLPHAVRQVQALLRAALGRTPAKPLFHIAPGDAGRLRRRLDVLEPDLVLLMTSELAPMKKALGGREYGVVVQNVEWRLYKDHLEGLSGKLPFLAPFFRREVSRMRALEEDVWKTASLLLPISDIDAKEALACADDAQLVHLPPIFAGELPVHQRPQPLRPLRLCFPAKMSWWPNRSGISWYIDEVHRNLPSGLAELHLYGPGSEAMNDPESGVIGHGFVDDINEVWRDNHVMICPIWDGSGVNVKFGEAIFNGMPVIATSFSGRGLPKLCDEAIVFLDNAGEWQDFLSSDAVMDLCQKTQENETRRLFSMNRWTDELRTCLGRLEASLKRQ